MDKNKRVGFDKQKIESVTDEERTNTREKIQDVAFVFVFFLFFLMLVEAVVEYNYWNDYVMDHPDTFCLLGKCAIGAFVIILLLKIKDMSFDDIKEYIKTHIWDTCFFMMLVWCTISAFLAEYREISLWGAGTRRSGLLSFYIYASFYLFGRLLANTKRFKHILYLFLFGAVIQQFIILSGLLGLGGWLSGTFINTNHCGYFLSMTVFTMAGLIYLENNKILKFFEYVFLGMDIFCLVMNDTFGSYLAVAFGLVFMIIIYWLRYKNIKLDVIMAVVLFVVVSFVTDRGTGIVRNNLGVTGRDVTGIVQEKDDMNMAGSGRWKIWKDSVKLIKETPVFGCGADTSDLYMNNISHNEILQYTMENGFPAIICYLSGLIILFVSKIKKIGQLSEREMICGCAVFAYLISSLFGIIIFSAVTFFWLLLGILGEK